MGCSTQGTHESLLVEAAQRHVGEHEVPVREWASREVGAEAGGDDDGNSGSGKNAGALLREDSGHEGATGQAGGVL